MRVMVAASLGVHGVQLDLVLECCPFCISLSSGLLGERVIWRRLLIWTPLTHLPLSLAPALDFMGGCLRWCP